MAAAQLDEGGGGNKKEGQIDEIHTITE